MKVTEVSIALNRSEARILAAVMCRGARTAGEKRFVRELLDRIPLDLHPKEIR